MSFQLREYQSDLIGKARAQIRAGEQSVLMVAPTGAGKTALAAYMLGTASSRGNRCWFMVHRRELITQSSRTFDKVGISHGIVSAGFTPDRRAGVQIASVQTLTRRMEGIPPPDMIVWDECHHIASASWAAIFSAYPDVIHVGLTATPCRLDGRGLGDWFNVMVEGPTTKWLIENGFLSPYKLFAPSIPDMTGVHTRGGDYVSKETAALMNRRAITGDAIQHYRKLCDHKRAIVFATSIEHSKNVVAQFQENGYAAAHLDGSTDRRVRDQTLRDFEAGRIKVVSNVDLFGEGFDLPAIEAVILLRPTQSTGLYLQMVGRGLRTSDGKDHAVILDHAGNVFRHGLPDEVREWDLNAKPKTKKGREAAPPVQQCDECFYSGEPFSICPACGHEKEVQTRTVQQVEGTLVELDKEKLAQMRKKEQRDAKSLEDLIELGRSRGYKFPEAWAKKIYGFRRHRAA
ncbi:MAG: helicase [Phenylobacterium zucineum]|nr:MAG: helicase [Phenylobacterium zucineum]